MAKLRLIRLEHRKDIKLEKTSWAQDHIINRALITRARQIRDEQGLPRYSLTNLIASLALSDPKISTIIEKLRRESGTTSDGRPNYHRETALGSDGTERSERAT